MVRVWGVRRFVGGAVAALAISALPGLIGGATPAAAASNDITLSTTGRLNAIVVSKAASHPATEVEPDSLAWAGTMVAAFQVGRFFNGGSSNIGWATSTDNGATWRRGFLPSTTVNSSPPGPWSRLSDPSVGYDARHGQWLIASLPVSSDGGIGPNIIVSRSTNGTTWGAPVTVVPGTHSYDKEWIACDNSGSSPS